MISFKCEIGKETVTIIIFAIGVFAVVREIVAYNRDKLRYMAMKPMPIGKKSADDISGDISRNITPVVLPEKEQKNMFDIAQLREEYNGGGE